MNLVENVDHYTSSCGYCSSGDSAAMVSFTNACAPALKHALVIDTPTSSLSTALSCTDEDNVQHHNAPRHQSYPARGYAVLLRLLFLHLATVLIGIVVSSGHVGAQIELRGIPGPA